MARWRYPTLTVHKIDVSLNNPTIIPRQAKAAVSMRIVPDQDLETICEHFKSHVERTAKALGTDNEVKASLLGISSTPLRLPLTALLNIGGNQQYCGLLARRLRKQVLQSGRTIDRTRMGN
jgi:acetylornithine deacetylase/succinyl-diaminopimelate desuccinylase-like protein